MLQCNVSVGMFASFSGRFSILYLAPSMTIASFEERVISYEMNIKVLLVNFDGR